MLHICAKINAGCIRNSNTFKKEQKVLEENTSELIWNPEISKLNKML